MRIINKLIPFNIFIILMALLISNNNSFGQISVVVSKSSKQTISQSDAKEVFAGSKTTWSNGNKVQVVDQSGSDVGKIFYDKFLGKSVNQVRVQWTKLVLSGQATAPVKAADDDDVKKNVAGNANALGYISSKSLDSSVKELFRIE
jgi:ABC-type phosphate transport system substrate-binding protein